MNSQLANQIAQALDQTLFHSKYCTTARANAQSMLIGRTHYVDDNTLRYFGARITSAQPSLFGLFYRITESVRTPDGNRGFRTVLFDLSGQVVYRPSLDEMHTTSTKAEKAFYAWYASFNEPNYYREQLALRAVRARDQAARLEAAFNVLCDEVTA